MNIIRYFILSLLIICSSVILTGCWDSRDIELRSHIFMLAVDKNIEKSTYECSVLMPVLSSKAGGEGESKTSGAVYTISAEGSSFLDSLNALSAKIDKPFFFGYTMQVLFGESLARDGIAPVLDVLKRLQDLKRDVVPLVVKGNAKDVLSANIKSEPVISFYLRGMLENPRFYDDKLKHTTLGDLYRDLAAQPVQTTVLSYISATKDSLDILGLALFKQDKLVDICEKDAVSVMTNIRNKEVGTILRLGCPDPSQKGSVVFLPYHVKSKLRVDNDLNANYTIKLDGGIFENTCNFSTSTLKNRRILERKIAEKYESEAQKLVQNMQRQKLDPFFLGLHLSAFKARLWDKDNWPEQFSTMPISIKYEVDLNAAGLVTD